MKRRKRWLALTLALALLGGCGQTVGPDPELSIVPAPSIPAESTVPTPSPEELAARAAAVEAAEAALESFRWPEETEVKTLAGQEVELVRYHGEGWSVLIPRGWEQPFIHQWRASSGNAGFSVDEWYYPVNNPKIYRAQQGSWRHETGYPAPFDYYYDDDGGYQPPAGGTDCVYFFAPAGEHSYEFTLSGVVGETSDAEKAILEAMLLSFTQDESSRTLYSENYQPGQSEWDFAMAGLLAGSEKLWASWTEGGYAVDVDGKTTPEYVPYAMALAEFQPGEFVRFSDSERPEGMEEEWPDSLTLSLPDSHLWLYFYEDSPWVRIHLAGESWWTKAADPAVPEKSPYDAAMGWMQAEREWQKQG